MACKSSTEMLSSIPKHKKVVPWLIKKTPVLTKLHSGMYCSSVSSEFNVNKSQCILNKLLLRRNRYKTRLY